MIDLSLARPMKYVQINTVPYGSTGSIALTLHDQLLQEGECSWVFWGRGCRSQGQFGRRFGKRAGVLLDIALTRLDGRIGGHSKAATKELLTELDRINPDVVHLHNLHGYYLNIDMLFHWLAANDCEVRWTLHDCWPLTGHCVHFTYIGCEQWKRGCAEYGPCKQLGTYPKTYARHRCSDNYKQKKSLFTSIDANRMTLIAPTQWLADRVSQSFLKKYPIEIIRNPIDKASFKPTPSDFREKHGLEGKTIVLGVAHPWSNRKGLGEFIRLSGDLDDGFVVVLVGLSNQQKRKVPKNIIALGRVDSKTELARLYTAADIFVNPSVEETFGLTVAEALACGTTVLVRKDTACAEVALAGNSIFSENTYDDLLMKIKSFRYGKAING